MPRKIVTPLALLVASLLAFFAPAGQITVAQGFTVGEEKEAGEKLLTFVRREFKLLEEPDLIQYINRLGNRALKVSGPHYFDYHFFVLDNRQFNAFAAPSGLIFFHTGLIDAMTGENELISVMAHEIGHVQCRHIAERIDKSAKVSLGTLAMILTGIAVGNPEVAEAVIVGSMAAAETMNLNFSRQDEEEADRFAYKLLRDSNRDPQAMLEMLRKMHRISRLKRDSMPPYLMTHPEPQQRMNYVQDLLLGNDAGTYEPEDDFAFERFKYRINSLTRDPADLLGRYRRQVRDFNPKQRQTALPYYGQALLLADTADFAGAAAALQKVIALYPDKPILLTDLGVIKAQQGETKAALALFERARRLDPDDAYTTYNLARSLEQAGNSELALRYYQELLPVLPQYPRLHHAIGQLKAAAGNKGEGYYHIGVYYWLSGDGKNAELQLQRAMAALKPGDRHRSLAEELSKKIKRLGKD